MDIRPQSHEIIRTWAFYTIAKALLHEGTIPWQHVVISGWMLDPDRKKMSKSKGNVVTPMHLLDQYGADAVRYWALAARLGTDTAFDEKVLKVGKRLVTKLCNAAKFVLAQAAAEGADHAPARLALPGAAARHGRPGDRALEELDYAPALDATERFFWAGFTDTYLELVKARARSETDAAGRASAVAALQLALGVLLRLLAPYVPYVTDEVWSWGFAAAGGRRSIHRAPWPSCRRARRRRGARTAPPFDAACAFLEAVRRAKSAAGATVGRHLDALRVARRARRRRRCSRPASATWPPPRACRPGRRSCSRARAWPTTRSRSCASSSPRSLPRRDGGRPVRSAARSPRAASRGRRPSSGTRSSSPRATG